ncbi:hypothetical protein PGT21_034587 [Puccinia graminis f. sp. tritici]|uniref:Uncharacterized protein n=1 Tax=Puccinia graminis f. sp. tritici TaxID=56615 RepID=A0A5B0RKV9_PUCGR|nr:hypothetical protein PGT21_034587 [Puccinia graminis f. sp. tritici]KAA1125665.1 hypothetical protein PGTUg99_018890 [Puccinia graminis f. sp. tritici]
MPNRDSMYTPWDVGGCLPLVYKQPPRDRFKFDEAHVLLKYSTPFFLRLSPVHLSLTPLNWYLYPDFSSCFENIVTLAKPVE